MKKFLSIVLSLAMVFSLSATAFAQSPNANANNEFLLELTSDIGDITVTGEEDPNGNINMYEYRNGVLAVMTRFTPGDTHYERMEVSQSRSAQAADTNWTVVDFSHAVTTAEPMITPFADNTRHIGYMHYNNVFMGEILSIKCHVNEWYASQKQVLVSGTLGTAIDFAQFVVGAIGIPLGFASSVVNGLLSAAIVTITGNTLKALVSTEVYANIIDQRIYGVSTSHSGKPTGDLGNGKITYVTANNNNYAGQTFYEGYTTHLWGTGELGRMMFWKVFGVEYTPTSWTGVDG